MLPQCNATQGSLLLYGNQWCNYPAYRECRFVPLSFNTFMQSAMKHHVEYASYKRRASATYFDFLNERIRVSALASQDDFVQHEWQAK